MSRKNNFFPQQFKLDGIETKKGDGNYMIGRAVGLSESTVRIMLVNRKKIEKMKNCYGAVPPYVPFRAHEPTMV